MEGPRTVKCMHACESYVEVRPAGVDRASREPPVDTHGTYMAPPRAALCSVSVRTWHPGRS